MRKKQCASRGTPVAERKRQVLALRASGLSEAAFCRREGIPSSTLYRWKQQVEGASRSVTVREQRAASPARERPLFAEVQVRPEGTAPEAKSPASSPFGVAIVLSSGDRLFLSDACDPHWLGQVVRALRSGPC